MNMSNPQDSGRPPPVVATNAIFKVKITNVVTANAILKVKEPIVVATNAKSR